jgi:hypothetical protein
MRFLQQGSHMCECECDSVCMRELFSNYYVLHAAPCKRDIYLKRPEPAVHSLGRLYRSPPRRPPRFARRRAAKNTIWKIRLSNTHITYPAAAVSAVKCVMAARAQKNIFFGQQHARTSSLQTAKLNGKRLAGDSKMRPESERGYFLLLRQLKRQSKFLWLYPLRQKIARKQNANKKNKNLCFLFENSDSIYQLL